MKSILILPGWLVQYIVSVRNGDPKEVGYIASGFWTGFTLGRVVLADITHYFGERRMVFVYLALAITMQLLFWLVPNIIVIAVAVCLLGELCLHSSILPCYQMYYHLKCRIFYWPVLSDRTLCPDQCGSREAPHRGFRLVLYLCFSGFYHPYL
jgi:MFS family permease